MVEAALANDFALYAFNEVTEQNQLENPLFEETKEIDNQSIASNDSQKKRRCKRGTNDVYVELRKNNGGVRIRADSIETFGSGSRLDLSTIIDAQHLAMKLQV